MNKRTYGEMEYYALTDTFIFTIKEVKDGEKLTFKTIDKIIVTGSDIARDYGSKSNYQAAKKEIEECYNFSQWGFKPL